MTYRPKTTIDDVARRAGVSLATVSRALRGLPHVRPEMRARVEQAALELHYVADGNAARLASGRSRTVGLIAPLLTIWYTSQIIAGVEDVLQAAGYDVLISALSSVEHRRKLIQGRLVFQQRVDGVILVDVFFGREGARKLQVDLPVILAGESVEGLPSLGIDNRRGAQLAAEHLAGLGHERVAIVGGMTPHARYSPVPALRREGFRAVCEEHNVTVTGESDGHFTTAGGHHCLGAILHQRRPPTALFCFSDEMAFGVLQAARELGVRVPDDIAVVGFDDHPTAEAMGLTTVRQPVRDIGRRSAERVLMAIDDPKPERQHETIPVELVVRESTVGRRAPSAEMSHANASDRDVTPTGGVALKRFPS